LIVGCTTIPGLAPDTAAAASLPAEQCPAPSNAQCNECTLCVCLYTLVLIGP